MPWNTQQLLLQDNQFPPPPPLSTSHIPLCGHPHETATTGSGGRLTVLPGTLKMPPSTTPHQTHGEHTIQVHRQGGGRMILYNVGRRRYVASVCVHRPHCYCYCNLYTTIIITKKLQQFVPLKLQRADFHVRSMGVSRFEGRSCCL